MEDSTTWSTVEYAVYTVGVSKAWSIIDDSITSSIVCDSKTWFWLTVDGVGTWIAVDDFTTWSIVDGAIGDCTTWEKVFDPRGGSIFDVLILAIVDDDIMEGMLGIVEASKSSNVDWSRAVIVDSCVFNWKVDIAKSFKVLAILPTPGLAPTPWAVPSDKWNR